MALSMKVFLGIFTLILSLDVMACGDTLYRVGKGVSYRVYTAPLPGSVLVYGNSESALKLAEALAQSGHGVRFVDNRIQLTSELSTSDYDIVIAPFRDHDTIKDSASASGNTTTVYLPVAQDRQQAEIANKTYSRVMVADQHEIKHYLKAIHKTLKEKA